MICAEVARMFDQMKTKTFYFAILFILATSVGIWLLSNPTPNMRIIVSQTHRQINNLKNLPSNIKSRPILDVDPDYLELLGFNKHPFEPSPVRSLPVIGTSVLSDQYKEALNFLKSVNLHMSSLLVIIYDLGLDFHDGVQLRKMCNRTASCQVRQFNFEQYPSHIRSESLGGYRPICIQELLKEYGGVLWVDPSLYFISGSWNSTFTRAQSVGIMAWTIDTPTSALTHPKMFQYFKTTQDDFYFHRAIESNHLLIYNLETMHKHLMLPWVKCALMEECLNPTGAQNVGCNYKRKPFFRYSGCHHYDMSALNIVLGLLFDFDVQKYSTKEHLLEYLHAIEDEGRNISVKTGPGFDRIT